MTKPLVALILDERSPKSETPVHVCQEQVRDDDLRRALRLEAALAKRTPMSPRGLSLPTHPTAEPVPTRLALNKALSSSSIRARTGADTRQGFKLGPTTTITKPFDPASSSRRNPRPFAQHTARHPCLQHRTPSKRPPI